MFKFIVGCIAVVMTTIFFFVWGNYHTTEKGALQELRGDFDSSTVIPTNMNDTFFLVDQEGNVSIAKNKYNYLFKLHSDFEVEETELNVFAEMEDQSFSFTKVNGNVKSSFGMLENEDVVYATNFLLETIVPAKDEAIPVIDLQNYLDDARVANRALWYSTSENFGKVQFLDSNLKPVRFLFSIPEAHRTFFEKYDWDINETSTKIIHENNPSTGENVIFEEKGYLKLLKEAKVDLKDYAKKNITEYTYILDQQPGKITKGTILGVDEDIVGAYIETKHEHQDEGSFSAEQNVYPMQKPTEIK